MSRNGRRRVSDGEKLEKRLARYSEAVRLVDEGKARPQVVEAVECIRQGLVGREAARKLGIAHATFYQRLNDPTDAANKARKARHHGTCKNCGGPTFNGGAREKPEYCRECAPEAHTFWTRERLIEAIREYHRRYGRQPSAQDWNRQDARAHAHPERLAEIEQRWAEDHWPSTTHVQLRFGSWSNAIEAAGFTPLSREGERLDPEAHRRHCTVFSREELIAAIREAGTTSSYRYKQQRNGGPSLGAITGRFGSWHKALEAAGLRKVAA